MVAVDDVLLIVRWVVVGEKGPVAPSDIVAFNDDIVAFNDDPTENL